MYNKDTKLFAIVHGIAKNRQPIMKIVRDNIKNIIYAILLLFIWLSYSYAEQLKTDGRWFAREDYKELESHSIALKSAKKWMQTQKWYKNNDYIYAIKKEGESYQVFLEYIVGYSEENKRMFAFGSHTLLYINKEGVVTNVAGGV